MFRLRITSGVLLILVLGIFFFYFEGCKKKETELGTEQLGEFAPPDAYEEGSKHPYYGSENEWNRRFFTEHITRFYKRRGQRQMLDIVEGRVDDAINYCRELLEKDPEDLESLFNLTVAQVVKGDINEAQKTLQMALDKGLPFSRFLAGPRDLLKPLINTAAFQKLKKQHNISLLHGPMLGDLTDSGVKIWLRTATESQVQIVASEKKSFTKPLKSASVSTKASSDFSVVIQLSGLSPNSSYFYNIIIDGKPEYKKDFPVFSTFYGKKPS